MPPLMRVGVWLISRMGTRMSGREPSTKILREPVNGLVTSAESSADFWKMSSATTAMRGS